jgi:hypothetical protein
MVTSASIGPACGEYGLHQVPDTPWSVRISLGTAARPALEIYADQILLDVLVATPLGAGILRGARRTVWDGRPQVIAWGRRPESGGPIAVRFSRSRWAGGLAGLGRLGLLGREGREGREGRGGQVAQAIPVAGWFWVATADGRFGAVTVTHQGLSERRQIVAVRR